MRMWRDNQTCFYSGVGMRQFESATADAEAVKKKGRE